MVARVVIRTKVFAAALALDIVLGDPPEFPHPVEAIGAAIDCCDRFASARSIREHPLFGRIAGVVTTLAIVGASYGIAAALVRRTGRACTAIEILLAASTLAWRSLIAEAKSVESALAAGDLERARRRLARIVGRDTQDLSEAEIVRATIETLAESLCDGIVAPLCYLALGGVPLALAYKATNTLDSTIGHIEAPYRDFGWCAARLDDVANFVPARLSALAIAAAARIAGADSSRSLRTCVRDARLHRSPNAGWPEAALAGALGVRLGGCNTYGGVAVWGAVLAAEGRVPELRDLQRARMVITIAAAAIALSALVVLGVRDVRR